MSVQRDVFFGPTYVYSSNTHLAEPIKVLTMRVICWKHPIAKSFVFFPGAEHWRNRISQNQPLGGSSIRVDHISKETVTNSKATPDCFVWTILIENQYTRVFLSAAENNSRLPRKITIELWLTFNAWCRTPSLASNSKSFAIWTLWPLLIKHMRPIFPVGHQRTSAFQVRPWDIGKYDLRDAYSVRFLFPFSFSQLLLPSQRWPKKLTISKYFL